MSDAKFELKVWATGELRDADGNLLDAEGRPVPDVPEEDEPEPEEAPKWS